MNMTLETIMNIGDVIHSRINRLRGGRITKRVIVSELNQMNIYSKEDREFIESWVRARG